MKTFILIFVFTFSFLITNSQDFDGTNANERKALRLVNSLPEIQNDNRYRRKAHIPLLRACIQNTPTAEHKHYHISLSEDLGFQLRTYDWFFVDAKTYRVYHWDLAEDKTETLSAWRAAKTGKKHKIRR